MDKFIFSILPAPYFVVFTQLLKLVMLATPYT